MNRTLRNSLIGGLTALTLAGSVGIGSAAAEDGDGSGGPRRAAAICNNLDEITSWLNARIAEVQHRIGYFTDMKARAEAAGRTQIVERLDKAIARLTDLLGRLQSRLARLEEWAATHCDPSGAPTTTVASVEA